MVVRDPREMGRLTVHCSADVADSAVQIEVRKANLALVGVTSPSQPIDVPAGTYHVRGVSASGLELIGDVDVVAGQPSELVLTPDTSDLAPDPPAMSSASDVESRGSLQSRDAGSAPLSVLANLNFRAFAGNLLKGMGTAADTMAADEIPPKEPGSRRFGIHAGATSAVQLTLPDRILNLVPPVSPRRECILAVRPRPDGIACEFELGPDAARFLAAYTSGQLDAATQANKTAVDRNTPALVELAEELLEDKLDDPMGAILSGLGLLRMGDLETLGEWTGKLTRGLRWSPDAVCVRGEHLARKGEHHEALDMFLQVGERGLPVFADSLSYALNRLRSYAWTKALASRETEVTLLVRRLQRFAAASDLKSAFVIYPGGNPNEPARS